MIKPHQLILCAMGGVFLFFLINGRVATVGPELTQAQKFADEQAGRNGLDVIQSLEAANWHAIDVSRDEEGTHWKFAKGSAIINMVVVDGTVEYSKATFDDKE